MRIARTTAVTMAALAVLLSLASCSSSTKAISKTDYLADANALCKTDTEARNAASTNRLTKAGTEEYVTHTIVPSVRHQFAQVQTLGYPKGDKAKLSAIFAAIDQALTKVAANPDAYLASKTDPFATMDQQLKAYGLTACESTSS